MNGSAPGPELILFIFPFFQIKLLAYSLEKCLHLVVGPRTTNKTSHTWTWTLIFGIFGHNMLAASLIHVFLNSYRQISKKLGTIDYKSSSSIIHGVKYRILRIFPPINHFISQKLNPTPNIQDWTPALQQISQIIQGIPYSYRHLLNQQCWDQY